MCVVSTGAVGIAAGGVFIAASVQAFVNWWKASTETQKLQNLKELLTETEREQVETGKTQQELAEDIILLERVHKEIDEMIKSQTPKHFDFGSFEYKVGLGAAGVVALGSMILLRSRL